VGLAVTYNQVTFEENRPGGEAITSINKNSIYERLILTQTNLGG
jgi:hypothetical protein